MASAMILSLSDKALNTPPPIVPSPIKPTPMLFFILVSILVSARAHRDMIQGPIQLGHATLFIQVVDDVIVLGVRNILQPLGEGRADQGGPVSFAEGLLPPWLAPLSPSTSRVITIPG